MDYTKRVLMKAMSGIVYFLSPLTSVWIVVVYIRLLSHLMLKDIINVWFLLIFFVPVVFFEAVWNRCYFDKYSAGKPQKKTLSRITIFGRIVFWLCLYAFWLVEMHMPANRIHMELIYTFFIPNLLLVFTAESYLAWLAFIIWIISYSFLTVKKRILRIFSSLIMPGVLCYMLFYHFYFTGGLGKASPEEISSQNGVKIFYSADEFPKKDYFHYLKWTEEYRLYPRDIYIDPKENALYANYAKTFGKDINEKSPNILRIDIDTKQTEYSTGYYIRAMTAEGEHILAVPWYEEKVYELDKRDLSVIRTFPAGIDVKHWETSDIRHDIERKRIFICTDIFAGLYSYDYETGNMLGYMIPPDARPGTLLWNICISDRSGMLYVTGTNLSDDIYEVDPENMKVIRTLDLDIYGASALEIDEDEGVLYCQAGGTDSLYLVGLDDLKIRRVLKGEPYVQKIRIDRERKAIYMLSFLYGRLIAVNIESGERLWSVKVGGKPAGLAVYGDDMYINSMAGIVKIELDQVWKKNSLK
ncbi:MAG: hypothetical protein ABIH89_04965 [Elusimicrobiota bacterium]